MTSVAVAKPPVEQLSREQLLEIYRFLKLNRMVEERLTNLYRQSKVVGGLYRSLGQEGSSVGASYALERGDIMTPLIRNLGAIFVRGGKPRDVLCQYMARAAGPTRGRDLNTHFGWLSEEGSNIAVISMLGDMVPILAGAALAERMKGKKTVALTWLGDGGVSTGAFHEGFNFACAQKVPLVVVVENNKWAYSTPTHKQMANTRIVDRAKGYGCFGEWVDGNDVLAVYEVTRRALERARQGLGPTLIEADTMRMRGHAEHDDMKYVPKEQLEEWSKKDPIARYERHLLRGIATADELHLIVREIEAALDQDVAFAEASPHPSADTALEGVYGDRAVAPPIPPLVREWEAERARKG
ncbi:MAG TPA: thiamine pyrophosphate-dependent dehydrogenase E1 component subunit alpha [Vicinamibacteria bacterium]